MSRRRSGQAPRGGRAGGCRYPVDPAGAVPVRVVAALLAILLGVLVVAPIAAAQSTPVPATPAPATPDDAAGPVTCRVGIEMVALHGFDVTEDTFEADFWMWSVCPNDRYSPLETMDFINANAVELSLQEAKADDGVYWTSVKVEGTFRHYWNLDPFPFDRQELRIEIEDAEWVASRFAYAPDVDETGYEPEAPLDGWKVVGSSLDVITHTYDTTYGDPTDTTSTSDFSRLVLTVALERDDLTGFFKITFVVYIAFLVSLLSYLVHHHDPTMLAARLGIISGTLFAVAVSMGRATDALSSETGLTLVDKIHIVALVMILVDAITALITQILIERGRSPAEVGRFNGIVMAGVVIGFVVANAWLIARVAVG